MKHFRNILLVSLSLLLLSCTAPEVHQDVCAGGECYASFWIDIEGHPGSYQDSEGVWHIKHAGVNYFTVKGQLSPLDPHYIINNIPLVVTSFDSNFFYLPGNITWTYPVYSYQGLWSSSQMNAPIVVDTKTYTFPELSGQTTILNLVGYVIQPNTDYYANESVLKSYFCTNSRYTYSPQQSMAFFEDFIGKSATIYIIVTFGENKETVEKELRVIFEQ